MASRASTDLSAPPTQQTFNAAAALLLFVQTRPDLLLSLPLFVFAAVSEQHAVGFRGGRRWGWGGGGAGLGVEHRRALLKFVADEEGFARAASGSSQWSSWTESCRVHVHLRIAPLP